MLFLSMTHLELTQWAVDNSVAFELRLDLFPSLDLELLQRFLQNSTRPVMLTLRRASQGGGFQGGEPERETLIKQLLSLDPHFFDLEYDMRPEFLSEVLKSHPKTQFILSYHNFQKIPENLVEIYRAMAKYPVFSYKIAAMTHSTNDALKMLIFAKKHPKTSVICMG